MNISVIHKRMAALFTLIVIVLLALTGCSANPVLSYLEEIEEKGIIPAYEVLEADSEILLEEIGRLVEAEATDSTIEEFNELKAMVNEFIVKQDELIAITEGLDTSDEVVKDANSYLVESISKQRSAISLMNVMIDNLIELNEMIINPDLETLEEDLNRINSSTLETEETFFRLIAESEEALNRWDIIIEENLD